MTSSNIKHRSSVTPAPARIAFVTGTLAESALREVLEELRRSAKIEPTVVTLNIQVAALMTAEWVAKKLSLPSDVQFDRVILPGYCRGEVSLVSEAVGLPVELGPRDLQDLPEHFGQETRRKHDFGRHDIQIIAEINHAPRLAPQEILRTAQQLAAHGADIIDVGCDPQSERDPWRGVADVVKQLRDAGLRVSIDSFHPTEVAAACRSGAELVLSVNAGNREHAADWGAEVVVLPDRLQDLSGLEATLEHLDARGVKSRIDPVIEPIGMGFAASLGRYLDVRRRFPRREILMGVGNLSEMTEVDSAGVNMLLLGFCQELGIRSVLTTQVINWARSSVRELDAARRLAHFAVTHRVPPKHLDSQLVMLRDAKLRPLSERFLKKLAAQLTDANVRLFANPATGELHAMNKHVHARGEDPYLVFDALQIDDPSHAFYLGYELAKAVTALTLGKNYTQDQALNWGLLTRAELSHHERRRGANAP